MEKAELVERALDVVGQIDALVAAAEALEAPRDVVIEAINARHALHRLPVWADRNQK